MGLLDLHGCPVLFYATSSLLQACFLAKVEKLLCSHSCFAPALSLQVQSHDVRKQNSIVQVFNENPRSSLCWCCYLALPPGVRSVASSSAGCAAVSTSLGTTTTMVPARTSSSRDRCWMTQLRLLCRFMLLAAVACDLFTVDPCACSTPTPCVHDCHDQAHTATLTQHHL